MNLLATTAVVAVLAAATFVVDVAMTSPILYVAVMAAGVTLAGWLAVRPSWKS